MLFIHGVLENMMESVHVSVHKLISSKSLWWWYLKFQLYSKHIYYSRPLRKYCRFRLTGGKQEFQVGVSSSLLISLLALQQLICEVLSSWETPASLNASFCCLFMLVSICSSHELSLFDWYFFLPYSCEIKWESQQYRQDHRTE